MDYLKNNTISKAFKIPYEDYSDKNPREKL